MTDDRKNNVADTRLICPQIVMSKNRIKKNILVMCVGAFTLFTAYDGPTMLQSTMNKEGGIGVAALAINYACFFISALLFPKYFIKKYGSKTTFVLSMILYIPYIASNYYPHWAVMIPVSVLIGFSAALLWSSQATYLNDVSVMLAKLSILDKENNTRHLEEPSLVNYSKKLEANDKIISRVELEVRSKKDSCSELETNNKNSNNGVDACGKNSSLTEVERRSKTSSHTEVETSSKNSSNTEAKSSHKNTFHTDPREEIVKKTPFHTNLGEANDKNKSYTDLESGEKKMSHNGPEISDKNTFYTTYLEASDKISNQIELKKSYRKLYHTDPEEKFKSNSRLGLEKSFKNASPSEIETSDKGISHIKLEGNDEAMKQQIATDKNNTLKQFRHKALPSTDNVQSLEISECRSLSNKYERDSAEKYRKFPSKLADDIDYGVRTISVNSVLNISEKIKKETHQNKTSGVHMFDIYHTNSIIKTPLKKLQRDSLELFRNKVESITARVFGIHGMAFLLSHLSGNLLAYFILKRGVDEPNVLINSTCAYACGANYCNAESNCLTNNLEEVSYKTRIILTTVCVSLAVISILIVALFLEPLETETKRAPFSLQFLMATYEITKRTDLVLLIPYTLYLGQIQGFFAGEFNKAYVSCAWGTHHVSLVSISYGFFCAVFATSSGWIVKLFGRKVLFTFAALLNIAFSVLLLLWKPLHPEMFFTTAGTIGAFVGMIWSQLRAFYGVLFKTEEEAAFGAFYVWYSIGFCLSFAYSTYFCTSVKIYVLLFVSNVGYIGYLIVEKRFSKFKKKCSVICSN